MILYQFFFLFFFLSIQKTLQQISEQQKNCFENLPFYTTDLEIQAETEKLLQNFHQNPSQQININCLNFLINRGFFEQALYLYENYYFTLHNTINEKNNENNNNENNENNLNNNENNINNNINNNNNLNNLQNKKAEKEKLNNSIRNINSQFKRNLESFYNHFHSLQQPAQVVQPAIQWAQSNSSIFINGKLGLRIDSPGCLTCKVQNIELTENYFNYTSFGIYSHQPVTFNLYLEFEHPIDVEKSKYQNEATIGSIFFEFVKKEPGVWRRPNKNQEKQISVWWDMQEKHRKIMDKWEEMVENEKEEKEKQKRQKKKEKKQKRKEEKEKLKAEKLQQQKNNQTWFDWAKDQLN
ncbi:HSP20-like chaperone [Pseudocohnilembus persalinus]|uniref:HSP20-like chaperone n=1 Tax=Pseudocohnilembus persalinus TaxID=266149 RepID=A0A0V0QNY6_PSEPJ|nr:HSP20-like chaperone [Pseudocohnilembus persalinus]|eukprot:KRX03685.1 HSP20-like chaperone [Pseudocohnilembus persalinus]